jgi:hypothetical protein
VPKLPITRNHVICAPLSSPGVLPSSVAVGYQLLEWLEWYLMSTTVENRARGIFPWDCTRLNLRTQFSCRPFAGLGASIILAIHGTSIVDLFGPGGRMKFGVAICRAGILLGSVNLQNIKPYLLTNGSCQVRLSRHKVMRLQGMQARDPLFVH